LILLGVDLWLWIAGRIDMANVDTLKACVSLQHILNFIENEQKWMTANLKGLRSLHRKWFLSRWNSEVVSVGLGVGLALTFLALDAFTNLTYTNTIEVVSLATMIPGIFFLLSQNFKRQHMIGADEQLSSPAPQCDLHILDAFVHHFAQKHADISAGFVSKIHDLKANGLTPYQAHRIVRILQLEFGITEEMLLNDILLPAVTVDAQIDVAPLQRSTQTRNTLKL